MARALVLLVGLTPSYGEALAGHLERRGYDVVVPPDYAPAEAVFAGRRADVAVVDMAAAPGMDLLRRHAGPSGPSFVMIAPRPDVIDKVLALELGAADVVERGIEARELAARIGRQLARRGGGPDLLVLERATVDMRAALVMHRSGDEEALSPGQVAMIRLFVSNAGKILSRNDIMAAAPAEAADAYDRSIDSRIVRLRRKLDTDSIVTIRGIGYRFEPPAKA